MKRYLLPILLGVLGMALALAGHRSYQTYQRVEALWTWAQTVETRLKPADRPVTIESTPIPPVSEQRKQQKP